MYHTFRNLFILCIAIVAGVTSCHQELESLCNTLTAAQSMAIPGGSGTCTTICQVDTDHANFEVECSLNDQSTCAAESGYWCFYLIYCDLAHFVIHPLTVKACAGLKMMIELLVTNKFNCQVSCDNTREPFTFDLKVVCT